MAFDPYAPPENPYAPPGDYAYAPAPPTRPVRVGVHIWLAAGVACVAVVTLVVVVLAAAVTTPPPRAFRPSAAPPANALVVPDDSHGEGFSVVLPDGWSEIEPEVAPHPTTRLVLVSETGRVTVGSTPKAGRLPLDKELDRTLREIGREKGLRWRFVPRARTVGDEPALMGQVSRARDDGAEHWIVVFYRHGTRFYVTYTGPDRDGLTSEPTPLGRILSGWRW